MDKKLKVVFFVSNYPSENNQVSGIFFKRIAEGLVKFYDIDIIVVAPRPYTNVFIEFFLKSKKGNSLFPAYELNNGVKIYRPFYFKLPFAQKLKVSHFFLYPVVSKIIKSIKPTVIDFRTSYPTYPFSSVIIKLRDTLNIPFIYTINGSHGFPVIADKSIAEFQKMLRKAERIQSVSKEYGLYLEHLSQKSCHLTVHPIDSNKIDSFDSREVLRTKFKLSPEKKYLLFVGELTTTKGVDTLLKIYVEGLSEISELVLIGDGPLFNTVFHEKIHFLGKLDNLSVLQYMKSCDLFVFLSRSEGMPNVLKEAGLLKIPILANRVGGIPQLLGEGIRGFMIESPSDNEIINTIKYIFSNPDLAKKKSLKLYSYIKEEYNLDIVCKSLYNIYINIQH